MKREIWQEVYAPRGDALETRVNNTLGSLRDETTRRMSMKKMMALALAAALVLAATVALAAGLVFSDRADTGLMAQKALEEQYGITKEMRAFFIGKLSDDGRTMVFRPIDTGVDERLGVYTVTFEGGKTKASWSHDGEAVGDDLTSPVWDTKLLGEAIARRAKGEEWYEILIPEEKRQINVTHEQAIELAKKAIEEAYGEAALEGYTLTDAHTHVGTAEEMDEDGHGLWRYSVSFDRLSDGLQETYVAHLYADDGSMIDCKKKSQVIEETEAQQPKATEPPESREARERAKITIEEAENIAREAIETTYGLTRGQMEKMEAVWDEVNYPYPYDMLDGKPVISVWFGLTQNEAAGHVEGDGVYAVDVNVETGVIESILYDSGLNGNG